MNYIWSITFLTNLVPIDSPERALSIGTKFVKNRRILTKLWTKMCPKICCYLSRVGSTLLVLSMVDMIRYHAKLGLGINFIHMNPFKPKPEWIDTIHSDHFDTKFETCLVHNFVNIGRLLTKLVPIDRARSGLSIGTNFVKNRPILTKLWTKQVSKLV